MTTGAGLEPSPIANVDRQGPVGTGSTALPERVAAIEQHTNNEENTMARTRSQILRRAAARAAQPTRARSEAMSAARGWRDKPTRTVSESWQDELRPLKREWDAELTEWRRGAMNRAGQR
jgi:hypothetical protein